MPKTHTLIVRGVSKDQKNSLKRLSRNMAVKQSVNQVLLSIIQMTTEPEIEVHRSKTKLQKETV